MAYFIDFITEVKAICSSAVGLESPTGQSTNQITSVQGALRSFIEQINDQRIELPCLVYEFGEYDTENNLGIDNWGLKRIPITIHYVAKVGGVNGNQAACFQQALNICLTIDDPAFTATTFEPFDSGDVMTGLEAPINKALLADAQAHVISSCVRYKPGWLINFSLTDRT